MMKLACSMQAALVSVQASGEMGMASAALLRAVERMGRSASHNFRSAGATCETLRAGLLAWCGLLLCLGMATPAWSQPCLTCRTDRCPTKPDLKAWCGAPCKDPLAPPCPTHEPPAQPRIQVGSEPAGATVRLGSAKGYILGVTPLKGVELARGRHQLWLSLPGYEETTLEVQVQARGAKQFFATLQPLAEPAQQAVAPAKPAAPMAALVPATTSAAAAQGQPTQPAAAAPRTPQRGVPLYKKWWLWTVVGVVAAGAVAGIAGGIIASRSGPPDSPIPVLTATGSH